MKAELVSVGTEILMGQILNTNAQYISQKLAELGVDIYVQTTIGDNHDRLAQCIREGLERADIVILTGGLGPTADDLTKETAADVMGMKLEFDEASLHTLKVRFAAMHKDMTPNNLKQAMFPKDCIIMANPNGTAPGCIMERDGKAVALLPGPPKEMVPMFENHLMPYLQKRSGHILYSRVMRIFGKGESQVEYAIRDLMARQSNPTIAPYAKTGEVTLRVTAQCKDAAEGEALVEPVLAQIQEIVGDVVYATHDEELCEVCVKLLKQAQRTVAVAESCTGGMLSSMLVSVPGCSDCFIEGAVTYSNQAKTARLGVAEKTLAGFGAVSEETAREMAEGLRKTSGADYALSTTGIAGPDGGTADKPVGLVYVGLATPEGTKVAKLSLSGARERIRHIACLNALDMLRRALIEQ
ncbi:MAG: competence/damage-inducible protein A [Eubacteriales bacterium]|nr:competence/damage-inducible protein A [Eubacteriales bacterium]